MMYRLRHSWVLPILVLGVLLSACAEMRPDKPGATKPVSRPAQQVAKGEPGRYKVGAPYAVNGAWYYPEVDYAYRESGIASWYGPGFHGKPTANGEIYDQDALTAAHRTLPMPSMVRVTNLENGRSVKVRVNDRGPFTNGRLIDLSRRAAELLGYRERGTAKVLVEVIEDESRALAAVALSEEAAQSAPEPVPTIPVTAEALPSSPANPVAATQSATSAASQTALALPRRVATTARPELQAPKPDGVVTTVPVQPSRIFVQAGSFTQVHNAHKLRARLGKIGKAQIAQAMVDNQRYYRVRFGPMASVEAADRLLARLIENGHTDARVVVD